MPTYIIAPESKWDIFTIPLEVHIQESGDVTLYHIIVNGLKIFLDKEDVIEVPKITK